MGEETPGDRRRVLEEAFFAEENEKLLQRLRQAGRRAGDSSGQGSHRPTDDHPDSPRHRRSGRRGPC
jgi:hypothetical protein